jgi:hypothetical protein
MSKITKEKPRLYLCLYEQTTSALPYKVHDDDGDTDDYDYYDYEYRA